MLYRTIAHASDPKEVKRDFRIFRKWEILQDWKYLQHGKYIYRAAI